MNIVAAPQHKCNSSFIQRYTYKNIVVTIKSLLFTPTKFMKVGMCFLITKRINCFPLISDVAFRDTNI